jgi:hypothetical protein
VEGSDAMPIYFLVDSITGGQVKVDLGVVACSCSEFRKNRMPHDSGESRHPCAHIEEAMAMEKMIGMADALDR